MAHGGGERSKLGQLPMIVAKGDIGHGIGEDEDGDRSGYEDKNKIKKIK